MCKTLLPQIYADERGSEKRSKQEFGFLISFLIRVHLRKSAAKMLFIIG
ncbi:hypothetical protein FRUB_09548 [Fimbriiglobus ruber]|uniref:Uncharacterized protein n=1 Tax=Fimbriiglobus ruber TaxID=1908690 RepID=A0A225DBN1_9BACT|nr:hypothetical protein FRUB_09548 [Fimbriiglobus ruber]